MTELQFNGADREGSIDFALVGARVVVDVHSVPRDDMGSRDLARVEASADQAEAIGQAWLEWAARARAVEHSNAPLPPLLVLMR